MIERDMTYEVLARLLEERTGQNLTPSRQWRVESALSALLREHDAVSVDELVAHLTSPFGCPLSSRVADALLNNETYFFRDQMIFDALATDVLPDLIARRTASRRLKVWCVGCSTGQEPLSIAMLLAERKALLEDWSIEIVATDVSHRALEVARNGSYTAFEAQRGLDMKRMIRWFEEVDGRWKVSPELLRNITYRHHNVLATPPRTGEFDLVLCRNVLLYFDAATRSKAFGQIATGMAPDGLLLLGAGETTVGQTACFEPAQKPAGMFRLTEAARRAAGTSVAA
ncbi:protein-glutamate O-methyltransferase CheR [Aurantiacibacter sp. MUD11]|uniref:CheR family methyltransferase n=1 Tax=Aurantiacibacter sp. MUD11 TaxID=3003265 RepID=UPI0022AA0A2E|nr:protein-glutamate O-methyltransferase CheR [Aurantiacibacter sp. MUD11]WAT17468.1 protein-glutamate O-methyltransferase CheR [Aurantiacibacter sp. MUD11]